LEIMKKYDIPVNDINKASKKIHAKEGLAENDVHYTNEGYKMLAEKISNFLYCLSAYIPLKYKMLSYGKQK